MSLNNQFLRNAIGAENLLTALMKSATDRFDAFPPYNLMKSGDDNYSVTLAVAGFTEAELSIQKTQNTLVIEGLPSPREPVENVNEIYLGIARRKFRREFQLANYLEVTGATLKNGLLTVELERRIPEDAKPKTIDITAKD